MKIITK